MNFQKMIKKELECSSKFKSISSNEVHVWRLLLNETNACIESLEKHLSIDEIKKATKFHFEKDSKKFIIAHGALREILSYYLGIKPNEIIFESTSFGKPIITDNQNNDNINFSLSHSDELVLYAVILNRQIGIDVERIRNTIDVLQIANKFFSSNEIAILNRAKKENLYKIFFQFWTRKEAIVKGLGKGLSFPLEQIDVSLINGKFLSPVKLFGEYKENLKWYVQDLFPEQDYVAAIAAEDNDYKISYLHYTHS